MYVDAVERFASRILLPESKAQKVGIKGSGLTHPGQAKTVNRAGMPPRTRPRRSRRPTGRCSASSLAKFGKLEPRLGVSEISAGVDVGRVIL